MKRCAEEQEMIGRKLRACDFGASSKSQIKEKIEQVLYGDSIADVQEGTAHDTHKKTEENSDLCRKEKGDRGKSFAN